MTHRARPGHRERPADREGATIPLSQTEPNVQPDQILATLDGDTRAYLQLLLQGARRGPRRARQGALRRPAALRAARPRPRRDRQGARVSGARTSSARSPTSARSAEELGRQRHPPRRVRRLLEPRCSAPSPTSSRRSASRCRSCPATLRATRSALDSGDELRQASSARPRRDLIPAAQALGRRCARRGRCSTNTTPVRNQIRPFTRAGADARSSTSSQAAKPLATTTKGLRGSFTELNKLWSTRSPTTRRARRGGLPVLARVAEPQHQRALLQPGRARAAARAASSCSLRHRAASPRASPRRARSCSTLQQIHQRPQSTIICPLDPSDARR